MKTLTEADGDLKNNWYVIALQRELKTDRPIRRVVYDTPYVIFKLRNGAARVFVDRCVHRGAQLSAGTVKDGRLQCPYHGWTYDAEGRVIDVPSDGPDSEHLQTKRCWKAATVPVVEQDGCIWIWTGAGAPATATPPWRFPYADDSTWVRYFMITNFENDVTHLVQNFMDVPHTVYVHDKWFRKKKGLKVPISVVVRADGVKVTYHQKNDAIGFTARILNPTNAPLEHTDEYVFPNITRVDYNFAANGFVINSQCTPVSRYQTRVYTWIAYRIGPLSRFLKPFLQFYTRQVIEQDVDIMANQGPNLKAFEELGHEPVFTADNGYRSSQADELHIAIERLRLQGVASRSRRNDEASDRSRQIYEREREFWI